MIGRMELTGIQFLFDDGSQSQLIENRGKDPRYGFEVDQTRTIRYISMLVVWGDFFEGIRLYDENEDFIIDRVWSDSTFGIWSEL